MTKALLDWETIDAEQINDIMEGKEPRPPKAPQPPPKSSAGDTPGAAPRRRRRPDSLFDEGRTGAALRSPVSFYEAPVRKI